MPWRHWLALSQGVEASQVCPPLWDATHFDVVTEQYASVVTMLDDPKESLYQRLAVEYGVTVHGARRVLEVGWDLFGRRR